MGENQGKNVELEVTKVAHGGISVARYDGRVVFVSDAIPGETVLARVSDDSKPSFWRADTVSVVYPSEFRQPHVWAEASVDRAPENRAGGAEFGHITLDHQRELKRQVLTEALQRMAGIESEVVVEALPGSEDGTGWRTRVRLHVAEDGTPGPYVARSHTVVSVRELPLATAELAAIAPLDEKFPGESVVDIIAPSTGNPWVLATQAEVKPRGAKPRGRQNKPKPPKPQTIVEKVGDREFRLDVRGFWQVHSAAAETLTGAVQDAVDASLFDPQAANLDLYGGVGLFAAALGDKFGPSLKITTVESDSRATDHAAENLAEWLGAVSLTARVERYLQQLRSSASSSERERLQKATVVLDPPRSGAGKAVVNDLADFAPAQIVYVACDPIALARDVALFSERGYELVKLRAFDLFPNTHHVEAVATLRRR